MTDYDLVGAAIDLVNEAVLMVHDGGDFASLRDSFIYLIEAERGLYPAAGELEAIAKEINLDPVEDFYYLCDKETRLPLFDDAVYSPIDLHDDRISNRGLEWIDKATVDLETKGREAAAKAAESAEREAKRTYLSDAEQAAVLAYAMSNGTQWKKRLRKELDTVNPVIRSLMSHPNFGDKWLDGFKLPKGYKHRKAVAA